MAEGIKMSKQIFLLYSCDEWKTKDSLRLVCASTSANKIKKAIITSIKNNEMEYTDGNELSLTKSVILFKKDWESALRDIINDRLKYGFTEYVYDGELQ